MYREGHIGPILLGHAPLAAVTMAAGFETLALAGGAGVAGMAMLQDQRLPFVKHRGPTLTVRFTIAVATILGLVGFLVGATTGFLALDRAGGVRRPLRRLVGRIAFLGRRPYAGGGRAVR